MKRGGSQMSEISKRAQSREPRAARASLLAVSDQNRRLQSTRFGTLLCRLTNAPEVGLRSKEDSLDLGFVGGRPRGQIKPQARLLVRGSPPPQDSNRGHFLRLVMARDGVGAIPGLGTQSFEKAVGLGPKPADLDQRSSDESCRHADLASQDVRKAITWVSVCPR
jgi:hypothetical protein